MENEREVRFDLYCDTCKHWHADGVYNPKINKTVFEEYDPCCYCIETAVREGSIIPERWEQK